jgi:FkbM family methyltransferase
MFKFWFKTIYYYCVYHGKKEYRLSLNGLNIRFSTTDPFSKYWFYPRYKNKLHEPTLTKFLVNFLRRTDVFFDIGANIGYFSCLAAMLCDKVHSFEIDAFFISILEKNIRLNELVNVTTNHCAVSNKSGPVSYYRGLCPHAGLSIEDRGLGFRKQISSTSIDRYIRSKGPVLKGAYIFKIDVEGAEGLVLSGMIDTLKWKSNVLVLMEVHPRQLARSGDRTKSVVETLEAHDYLVYLIRHRGDGETEYLKHADGLRLHDNYMIAAMHNQDSNMQERFFVALRSTDTS